MRILLALDTSPVSALALEEMASRLWADGTSFEVVSIIEPSPLWTTSEAAAEAAHRAREVVRKGVARLQSAGLEAAGSALFGDPRLQIIDRARNTGADFVFTGSHGQSAVGRFLLGNVASTILRHAPCSAGVIRADRQGRIHAGDEPRRILLATDGSEYSERAAQSVASRRWPAGTEVRVVSAVQLMLPAAHALFDLPFVESSVVEEARAEAMRRAIEAVAASVKILSGHGLTVSESVSVLFEYPREIILQEAAAWQADLIVLGSHGRRGPDRFLLGSVSESVATHASCSVEIIRATAA